MYINKKKWKLLYRTLLYAFIFFSLFFTIFIIIFQTSFKASAQEKTIKFYKKEYKRYMKSPELVYAIFNSMYYQYASNSMHKKQLDFFEKKVMQHIKTHADDPNAGYYMLLLAKIAELQGIQQQALSRYMQVSSYSPSKEYMFFENKNSVTESMRNIERLSTNPHIALQYETMLLEMSSDSIPNALMHYKIGKNYELLGEWEKAYKEYKTFIYYPTKTHLWYQENRKEKIDVFFRLSRRKRNMSYRTWSTPEEARNAVRNALYRNSASLLRNLRTPNFFTAQWREDLLDSNAYIPNFRIDVLLSKSNIYMQQNFDPRSTETTKLWLVSGWERVSSWYFVFRKIYQPDKPQINGLWEWAGIYLGDISDFDKF